MNEYYDEVEADLWTCCNRTDLRDLFRPGGGESKLTWRLVGNLIRHLPPQSATKTAMRNRLSQTQLEAAAKRADPAQGAWSQQEMLLASLLDVLKQILFTQLRGQGVKKAKAPEPTPRPGVRRRRPPRDTRKPDSAEQARAQAEAVWQHLYGDDDGERPTSGGWTTKAWQAAPQVTPAGQGSPGSSAP